ncbi:PREDICTED: MICOS complex subunit MIC60 [Cyprinodon variegatus]|uniref:MICOS complex subunit MIC60 n=1 Tax=Cyprinodon variegatus TaxID=28743 RepID=UPI0007427B2B|nr:PREDICTED: MICOS complex subunit MIC60 [Cyprinodon variegatus]
MLRVCLRGVKASARKDCGRLRVIHLQQSRGYASGGSSSGASRVVFTGLLTVSGGIGGTVLYANWDPKFRAAVEKNVPYSDWLLGLALGPAPRDSGLPVRKRMESIQPPSMMEKQKKTSKVKSGKETAEPPAPESSQAAPSPSMQGKMMESIQPPSMMEKQKKTSKVKSGKETAEPPAPESSQAAPSPSMQEASAEATQIISAISEVQSVPAPCDSQAKGYHDVSFCPAAVSASLEDSLASTAQATLQAIGAQEAALQAITLHTDKLKEAMEAEAPSEEKSTQWKDLEAALADRTTSMSDAKAALLKANEALDALKGVIDSSKGLKVPAARPLVLAAEENLHRMMVDLDKVVSKVQSAESEAKIVAQYSELVREAKQQFQREVSSLTPEIQANWKGLAGKLSTDDLNALIAHAHRRIDQLNRELAEQRVREKVHIQAALEQQKLEDQRSLENAVSSALQHVKEEARLEQERKLAELREVIEAEMRTQLRRQAAAHTDHVRDVLKVQEQELRAEAEQVLSSKMLEQETRYRQLSQEQLDNFTLDMNAAYARLKGVEEAIDSHVEAEAAARKAHQLWLSVEALNYALKTAGAESPSMPLEDAAEAVRASCTDNDFASALASALPEESLKRGVYSEASLRARFNALRSLARRVALIDESHNTLYQYFLSYLQAALLFEKQQEAPPTQLRSEDLDPFKLLSYASYCLEHGDLELAAKLVNQLRGEARRVVEDWLTEARLTLETRQAASLLAAYANAAGLGSTQVP